MEAVLHQDVNGPRAQPFLTAVDHNRACGRQFITGPRFQLINRDVDCAGDMTPPIKIPVFDIHDQDGSFLVECVFEG